MTATGPRRRLSFWDVADVQADLTHWYRQQGGAAWLRNGELTEGAGMGADVRGMVRALYAAEPNRVAGADPICVSAEMVDVVEAAMGGFAPEPLLPADLLTLHGFLWFERPIVVPDRFDTPSSIQGFSWMPYVSRDVGEVLVDRLTEEKAATGRQEDAARLLERLLRDYDYGDPDATASGLSLTIYAARNLEDDRDGWLASSGAPSVVPIHLTPWWFGMPYEGNEVDRNGRPTGAAWWWRILQTTLRLMQQQLSVSHRYRPDRAASRSLKRAGLPEDRDVVVVRLRREQAPSSGEPHDPANYSHRFIVNGHWRNQWYPSETIHRQIWISSYVKGSEDLPLIVRPDRAFVWSR